MRNQTKRIRNGDHRRRQADETEAEKNQRIALRANASIEITFTVDGAENVISISERNFPARNDCGSGDGSMRKRPESPSSAARNYRQSRIQPKSYFCNRYQVPYIPGCMTIKEMIAAMEAGADILKVFPGSALGPSFIKAVKGPLPQANLMPTGGVSLENVDQWIKSGCVAVGVGGQLTAPAKTGDYEKITELARRFIERIEDARRAR